MPSSGVSSLECIRVRGGGWGLGREGGGLVLKMMSVTFSLVFQEYYRVLIEPCSNSLLVDPASGTSCKTSIGVAH